MTNLNLVRGDCDGERVRPRVLVQFVLGGIALGRRRLVRVCRVVRGMPVGSTALERVMRDVFPWMCVEGILPRRMRSLRPSYLLFHIVSPRGRFVITHRPFLLALKQSAIATLPAPVGGCVDRRHMTNDVACTEDVCSTVALVSMPVYVVRDPSMDALAEEAHRRVWKMKLMHVLIRPWMTGSGGIVLRATTSAAGRYVRYSDGTPLAPK